MFINGHVTFARMFLMSFVKTTGIYKPCIGLGLYVYTCRSTFAILFQYVILIYE